MSRLSFANGHILCADGVQGAASFDLDAATIRAIGATGDAPMDLDGGWLVPGFIDTQVNGGGDVLFNDSLNVEAIAKIGAAHVPYGTTAFMPTLISAPLEDIAAALDAVDDAIAAGVPGVVGIHVEGPFLNDERKGIHDADHFRELDDEAVALLTRPRRGVVMVTLAPERNDTAAIRALVEAGVIVSIGHSNGSYTDTRAAIDAGARGVTHLFNAMSPLHHREPGVVGAALEDQTLWCGLIVDGAHVHDAALHVALAARPQDRFMLVTDAMPTVGSADKQFTLNGERITVENGVCVNADGVLAGSDLDMARAVRNMVEIGVAPEAAFAMAATYPAAFLGLSETHGAIAIGQRADWVWLDRDYQVRGTWIGGQRVF